MKIPKFLSGIANKAVNISVSSGLNKDRIVSTVRDEAHQFLWGYVLKQIMIFSSVFFVVGFVFGLVIMYYAK